MHHISIITQKDGKTIMEGTLLEEIHKQDFSGFLCSLGLKQGPRGAEESRSTAHGIITAKFEMCDALEGKRQTSKS